MADLTDDHIREALSVACEATRKEDLQDLDAVARNLELSDAGVLDALRAGLDYMLVLDGQREGWGVFRPSYEIGDKVYPAPLSRVPPSWFPIWSRAFSCAPYAYVEARFADLLWEARHGGKEKHKWGQRAIDAYLLALKEPFGEDVYVAEGARRALSLAKQLGEKTRQSSATTALRDLAREDIENPEIVPGITIPALTELVDLPPAQRPEDLGELIDAVFRDKQPLHVQLDCLGLKLRLAETEEERRDLWKAQVQAHADEGRSQQELARFMHFQNAIQLAEKYGLRGLANDLQQESGPLSEDSFQRVETETEIPAAKIDAYIGLVVGDDNLSITLRRFGGETPSGDPTQNRAFAQNLMNEFPLRSLVTNLITGDQGELVKQFQTREEYEDYQVVAIETQQITFFAGLAVHILKEIKQRYGALGADGSVFESDLVDETQAEWIALAVRHFEAGDYRSSVSVMAPRLENAIRSIARKAGINLFRDSVGGRHTGGVKALGKVLSELEGRIPEATRRYWSTLLTNPLGLDLRNKVSHGLLDHPRPQEAAVLIHAACHLLVLESQPPSDGQR